MSTSMQKRKRASHIFAREQHDHYAEPQWVSERLFDVLSLPPGQAIYDPACGFGRIPRAAVGRGLRAYGSDIEPRWAWQPDGWFPDPRPTFWKHDWFDTKGLRLVANASIVSNPPFKHAQRFAEQALAVADKFVALLLPTKWVQGDVRSRWLATTPLEYLMPLSPRPSMPPGAVWLSGEPVGGGTVDFSWFVWRKGYEGAPQIRWLWRNA